MPELQEVAVNTLPFWSRFSLDSDLRFDGTTLERTVVTAGTEIPVFDYRRGEQNVTALNGARATLRDTILTQAAQTRGGEKFTIHGISITKDGYAFVRDGIGARNGLVHHLFPPQSMQPGNDAFGPIVMSPEDWRAFDSLMWEILQKFFVMVLDIDGSRRIVQLGPTLFYPGVGGPKNTVDTLNGDAFVQNYMFIKEGITWDPAGSVDSNFVVKLQAAYDCVVPTWTAPDGLNPFVDPPVAIPNAKRTAIGRLWTQAWLLNFHGVAESPTSNVS